MFKFSEPEYFLLILVIPVILYYFYNREKKIVFKYPLAEKIGKNINNYFYIRIVVDSLLLISLIIALANPVKINKITNSEKKGINIIISLDTSGSMAALDFHKNGKEINRLEALKYVVNDFINKRSSDKIGLVVFGKDAFTQCPLTIDHKTLHFLVNNIELGMAGDSTAIGSALILSIKRLEKVKSKSKVIILVTDGRNNSGEVDPIVVAKLAAEMGIKIYTIGIGTKGKPVPILRRTIFGVRKIMVNVDLDDYTLKKIANITGAKYFNAQNFESLKNIISDIDKLEKTKFKVKYYYETRYYYYYFLLAALILLVIKILIFNGIKQVIP